jgi:type II secretory pathway component PulM
MPRDYPADEVITAARLRARIELDSAEVRTLEALPLQPTSQAIVASSKTDLECATTRLNARPGSLELDYLDRWLDTVEYRLRILRADVTARGASESTGVRVPRV